MGRCGRVGVGVRAGLRLIVDVGVRACACACACVPFLAPILQTNSPSKRVSVLLPAPYYCTAIAHLERGGGARLPAKKACLCSSIREFLLPCPNPFILNCETCKSQFMNGRTRRAGLNSCRPLRSFLHAPDSMLVMQLACMRTRTNTHTRTHTHTHTQLWNTCNLAKHCVRHLPAICKAMCSSPIWSG